VTSHADDGERTNALLSLAAATEALADVSSHNQLLELVVQLAARVINAVTASMLLLDQSTQELAFVVAYPHQLSDLASVRVPVGEGIAGLVAMTGQPMAISDARADPRHASSIAERTGYRPDSLLCVPLVYADDVIGVLELMDKQGSPAFDASDMETLDLFAQLAAVAIAQSRMRTDLTSLLSRGSSAPNLEVAQLIDDVEQQSSFRRTIELAELVREIANAGDEEVDTCTAILRSFAGYVRARSRTWHG
jgi:GAF domain-containing protein